MAFARTEPSFELTTDIPFEVGVAAAVGLSFDSGAFIPNLVNNKRKENKYVLQKVSPMFNPFIAHLP